MKTFKETFHEYCTMVREREELTDTQNKLVKFMLSLDGPLDNLVDFENIEAIFDKAEELGLTEADVFYCWMSLTKVIYKLMYTEK